MRDARGSWRRASLVLALTLMLAACGKVELYSSLTEREANDMLALLLRAGISAEKVTGKGGVASLQVNSQRVSDAVDLLNAAGLPHNRYATMGELFGKEGLISSPTEERVRYIYGVTQELSRTLSDIDGVLGARVHIVMPGNDPTGQSAKPSSAAVLIRYAPSTVAETLVPKIKELVVNSIEGLNYDRVSVVMVRAMPDDAASRLPAFPPQTEPALPMPLYAAAGGLALALAGNAVLAILLWRRRSSRVPAPSSVPAVT